MTTKKTTKPGRKRTKLVCPDCGIEMNLHAEKLREPRSMEEATAVDPVLGGVLVEHHTCPGCGRSAARPQR